MNTTTAVLNYASDALVALVPCAASCVLLFESSVRIA